MLARTIPSAEQTSPRRGKPGVSEIILPAQEQNTNELILPMLAHLSHQAEDRWLTWVCQDRLPKDLFESYGFNLQNVRIICSPSDHQTLWVMWEALNNSTSAFVVANFNHDTSVKNRERVLLENACMNGNSRALVLKYPNGKAQF